MSPRSGPQTSALRGVFAVLAGAIGAVGTCVLLRCIYLVLGFRLANDPAFDPHGYGLIAGTVLSVPAAVVAALAVPFAFPTGHRARVARITTPALLVITAALWVAFLTA